MKWGGILGKGGGRVDYLKWGGLHEMGRIFGETGCIRTGIDFNISL